MQLSKLGGGVSLNLSKLRAKGEAIKDVENATKGVVGVMKLLDNAFRYADQMGQRQGSGGLSTQRLSLVFAPFGQRSGMRCQET